MQRFLRLKHWRLFGLAAGMALCSVLAAFVSIGFEQNHVVSMAATIIMGIFLLLYAAIVAGWFYSAAINLHGRLPQSMPMSLRRFKICLFTPFVYAALLLLVPDAIAGGAFSWVLLLLHIFVIFAMLYCMCFFAKALVAVEIQRAAGFGDCFGEFILLWMWPVGIWFIQPRINRIFEVRRTGD